MKEDSINISQDIFEYDGKVLTPQVKYYEQYDTTCITSAEEIAKIFNDPTYPKEFRIGVTKSDDHSSSVRSEVLKQNAIGTVKYIKLDQTGSILGKVRIDLDKADTVLGKDNWIRTFTNEGKSIPLSVARRTIDKPKGKDMYETELDIRSYVATRFPRNKEIGVQ